MDFLSKFPIVITTATMAYKLPEKIDPEKIIYYNDIIYDRKGMLGTLKLKVKYNDKIYHAKVLSGIISICGIKDVNNAHFIFNKIIINYGLTPITYNDLSVLMVNAYSKFPPIKDPYVKYEKCKSNILFVYDSGNVIFSASSIHILTKQYLNLYAQYFIPTILWLLYQSNTSILHYIPKELIQLIIDHVTHIEGYMIEPVKKSTK